MVRALYLWHGFYEVVGTAAAALLGSMYVVASIGSGRITKSHVEGIRLFITPTVIHLTTVLFGCAIILIPFTEPSFVLFGALLLIGSLGELAYSIFVAKGVRQRNVEFVDRVWYAAAPILAYLLMFTAGIGALTLMPACFVVLAIAMGLLLAAGIRNAWDLLIFIVTQERIQS